MTLAQLKAKLIIVTGTDIAEVLFDWQEYLNEQRIKVYPAILWSLNGAKFIKDIRSTITQKRKLLTLTVFAIAGFDAINQDRLTVWDALEEDLDAYLNAVNAMTNLSIEGIEKIEGEYFPEGLLSIDSEVGIGYKVTLRMFC